MKLPATESKGDRLTASKIQASIQAPVQASVRQLARTLASIAPTQTPKPKAPKEKVAGEQVAREKAAREKIAKSNSSVENAASKTNPEKSSLEKPGPEKAAKAKTPHAEKVSDAKSVSRSSPVPNLPFINKDSKAVRVTFTLLLVRPWVLVAGLWLVSLLGSAAAIQGLIRPKVLMQALPEAVVEAPPVLTSSIINVADGDIEASATTESEATAQADTSIEAANDGGFPVWTVSALVGTCAAGCLVMSRRRAMARMSAARSAARARGRVRRKPVAANAVRTVDTVKSLKQLRKPVAVGSADAERKEIGRVKKRRQRNRRATAPMTGSQAAVAKGRKANHKPSRPVKAGQKLGQSAQGGRVLVSRSTAQKAHANVNPTRVRRVKKASSRTARRQAMVSVVPASESHALDWRNGSLAHQMDVRPQRRAAM